MHSSFNEVFNVGLQTSSGTSTGFTIKNSRFHTTTDTSGSSPTRAIVSLLNFVWGTGSPIAEGHLTNLLLENNDIGGNTTHNALSINGGVFDVIIRDNHIHHAPHACIDIKQNQNSSQRNRRFQILRNEVDHCETGIFTVESSDILDDQNIVHDGIDDPLNPGAAVAIKTHNVGFGATDNLRVQRNIVYNFPSGGQGISFDGCVDCESWNNTLYNVTTPRHFGSNANTNLAEVNNLIYSSGADNTAGFDGRFANAAGGDFRLCTGVNLPISGCAGASNAINAGSASPPVASNSTSRITAAANYTCNGNCDLGALETAATTACLSGSFSDNFNDNTIDSARWVTGSLIGGGADPLVTVNETSAQLQITPRSSVGTVAYNGMTTGDCWNGTGGAVTVELVQSTNTGTSAETILAWGFDGNNLVVFNASAGDLNLVEKVGGTPSVTSITYSNTTHRWLRLRHEPVGDLMKWETCTTPCVTWDERRSRPRAFAVTSMKAEMNAGTYESVVTPGVAIFDNFTLTGGAIPGAPTNLRMVIQ